MTSSDHALTRRSVVAHFSGKISPSAEQAMRAHLDGCVECRALYERNWLLAELDPGALPSQERLAIGLGLQPTAAPPRAVRWRVLASLSVAAGFFLWFASSRVELSGMTARGVAEQAARAQSFWVYRIAAGATPELAEHTIIARDELAFAYSNPAGKPYLLIFGVDERQRVHWYYPAWLEGESGPRSISARAGPGPHELPEAIGHTLMGRRLSVYAIFSSRPLDVVDVEQQLDTMLGDQQGDLLVLRRELQVSP